MTAGIERIDNGERFTCDEILIQEQYYCLIVNRMHKIDFACSPSDLSELAVGYAFTQGLLNSAADVKSLNVDEDRREISLETTSIQVKEQATKAEIVFSSEQVFALWQAFDKQCVNFRKTGAAHAVAMVNQTGILDLKEDVARHTALLKVLGSAILNDISFGNMGLLFSGRVAAQMVAMVKDTGIKVLLSHGAATSGAVEIAREMDITLAGFVRNQYMNIYTGGERITLYKE